MAKTVRPITQLLSRERLVAWATGTQHQDDGRHELARRLLAVLNDDCGDKDQRCIEVFAACMPSYFYNLSASHKRRYCDSIALAFCANKTDSDEFFDFVKRHQWPGRTRPASS